MSVPRKELSAEGKKVVKAFNSLIVKLNLKNLFEKYKILNAPFFDPSILPLDI